jgi:hypothetical protein
VAREVATIVALPRRRRPLRWMLEHARTLDDGLVMAQSEHALLPNVRQGLDNLVVEYEASALHDIHCAFYAGRANGPDQWPLTYNRLREQELLPCVAQALRRPNDALLKPTVLQHVTRYFLAEGWRPRQIASLVWSKYARDFAWGDRWARLDAQRRAEFDVRIFASAVLSGIDEAIDFNCVSSQEKGICPRSGCQHDLRSDRARLLARVAV